jgi:hypothetical protein
MMVELNSTAILERSSGDLKLTVGSPVASGYVDGKFSEARFHLVGGTLCSSDGKSLYVCDRLNLKIRHVDLINESVSTVATLYQSPQPSLYQFPEMLCFDRRILPSDSVLYVATRDTLCRLQLPESVSDVLRYRIDAVTDARVMSALLRDLWYIVASYLAEVTPSLTQVPGSHRTSVVSMLPSYDILVSTDDHYALAVIDPDAPDREKRVIAGKPRKHDPDNTARLEDITGLALDETRRCVYLSGIALKTIRRVSLPFQFFVSPPQFVSPP